MPTTNISQLRGALLEELILHFLRKTGYKVVSEVGTDSSLDNCAAGIQIKGRGCNHQIDAIADSVIHHPFSYSQRLLVEAKCYADSYKIGIEKVRNAVGVLKDVSEYWTSMGSSRRNRYHYQYALFSTSPYTKVSERYAFAHDIYLIPLQNSTFLRPAINIIRNILAVDFQQNVSVKDIRELFRVAWATNEPPIFPNEFSELTQEKLQQLFTEGMRINFALLAVLGGSFPIFLVPNPDIDLLNLENNIQVRIFWDQDGWYLRRPDGQNLFSFDLPIELFNLYAEEGILSLGNAIQLKQEFLSEFIAYKTIAESIQIIRFQLDTDWLTDIKENIATKN